MDLEIVDLEKYLSYHHFRKALFQRNTNFATAIRHMDDHCTPLEKILEDIRHQKEETTLLFVYLDDDELAFTRIQLFQIWGAVVIEYRTNLGNWRAAALSNLAPAPFTEELGTEDLETLIEHEILIRDGLDITLDQFFAQFRTWIIERLGTARRTLFKNDVLIPSLPCLSSIHFSQPVMDQFTDAIRASFAPAEIYPKMTMSQISPEAINAYSKAYPPKLPFDVLVDTADLRESVFDLRPVQLLGPDTKLTDNQGKPTFTARFALYPLDKDKEIAIVVHVEQNRTRNMIVSERVLSSDGVIYINCSIEFPNAVPVITLSKVKKRASLTESARALFYSLPTIRPLDQQVDVLLLIDGSIVDTQSVRPSLASLLAKITSGTSSTRVGYVVYGHYRNEANFKFREMPLSSEIDVDIFVDTITPLTLPVRGLSLALEAALKYAANEIDWKSKICHLILVGGSPPHPSKKEHRQYELREATTDLYENVYWRHELDAVKTQLAKRGQKLYLSSIWIEPPISLREGDRQYISMVWQTFSDDAKFREGLDSSKVAELAHKVEQTRAMVQALELSSPLRLPLAKPTRLAVH